MNYRHLYHAGNFADVVKHVVLIVLLQALQRKEAPFCFLDTHAGIGLYELESAEAQKKQEYENGIAKLFAESSETLPAAIHDYLTIVRQYNAGNHLSIYPGSPYIAGQLLRSQDQMILCELHPADYLALKENMRGAKSVAIHHIDAYLAMKAFIPPKQKRGLVLIDPPFEITHEFEKITHALEKALTHWRGGNFMVWYPLKNKSAVADFYRDIQQLQAEYCILHFSLTTEVAPGKLSACGILLINPPWQIKETLANTLPALSSALQLHWEFVLP